MVAKDSNIKRHENPPSGSRVFQDDRQMYGGTNMTKLRVTFCVFAKAPENKYLESETTKTIIALV
jgi:hypothetical protein